MKLLYIALRLDFTGDGASMYAMSNVLAFASQISTDILTFQCPRTTSGQLALATAGVRIVEVVSEPYNRAIARLLLLKRGHNVFRESERLQQAIVQQMRQNDYGVIVLELASAYLMPLIRKHAPSSKIVLSQHNYEYGNHLEYIRYRIQSPFKKIAYRLANRRYRQVEHDCIQKADAVLAISKTDQQLFQGIRKDHESVYILAPTLAFTQQKQHYSATCTHLLFLGMMDWYPNIEGVIQFIHHVFYPLLAQGGHYHLHIVGKNPDSRIQNYQSKHITVTGEVPDTDVYINQCDLLVVPNTLGGGVKIKVMEAIQKGMPLLVSKASAIGYEGVADYFVVNSAADFIRRIQAYPTEVVHYPKALAQAQEALARWQVQNKQTVVQLISDLLKKATSPIHPPA